MQYSVGKTGRTIVARLETGEAIYPALEGLAAKEGIRCAVLWIIGGIAHGGVVVGPRDQNQFPLQVLTEHFEEARELLGTGTIFPDESGAPKLHLHAAMGKKRDILVGCPREGAECWLVNEVVMLEVTDVSAKRMKDSKTGMHLLTVEPKA